MKIEKFMAFFLLLLALVPYGGPFAKKEKLEKENNKKKGLKNKIRGWVVGGMSEEKSNYHVIGKSSWNFNELYLRLKRMLLGVVWIGSVGGAGCFSILHKHTFYI